MDRYGSEAGDLRKVTGLEKKPWMMFESLEQGNQGSPGAVRRGLGQAIQEKEDRLSAVEQKDLKKGRPLAERGDWKSPMV